MGFLEKGIFSLATVVFILFGCGRPDLDLLEAPSDRVVTTTSDYPAVGAVILPEGRGLCTGTLIGPSTVLTAAHCTLKTGDYRFVTSFGSFTSDEVVRLGSGTVDDERDISIIIFDSKIASAKKGQIYILGKNPTPLERVRLVGFGCNDYRTARGSGVKRTGTNQIYQVNDFVDLLTPTTSQNRGILGPENRAGACFGDSGGPLLRWVDGDWEVLAVSHAGGLNSDSQLSQYVSLSREDNARFLTDMDSLHSLSLFDPCLSNRTRTLTCEFESATFELFSWIKWLWKNLLLIFFRETIQ